MAGSVFCYVSNERVADAAGRNVHGHLVGAHEAKAASRLVREGLSADDTCDDDLAARSTPWRSIRGMS